MAQISEHFEVIHKIAVNLNREFFLLQTDHVKTDEQIEAAEAAIDSLTRLQNTEILVLKRSLGLC
jgi:hypothetical protein